MGEVYRCGLVEVGAAPGDFGGVGDVGFAELGACRAVSLEGRKGCRHSLVESLTIIREGAVLAQDGDLAFVALFPQGFHSRRGTASAADHDDFLFGLGGWARGVECPPAGFYGALVAGDVDCAVLFGEREVRDGVECWGVFDVAGADVETGWAASCQLCSVL